MADQQPPPVTPPPPPPAEGSAPPPPPPKKGMSTGAKIAIGCGALAVLAIIVIVVVTLAGGMFLKHKAGDLKSGIEAQQQAGETIDRLESDHPFTPPQDGIVGEDRAGRFFAVTDDAWDEIEDWASDMQKRGERIDARNGKAGVGDVAAGLKGLGHSRVALAEALDDHDMPVSEYLWTGMALMHAYQNLDQPAGQSGVPQENLDLAADHRQELAEIAADHGDGKPSKAMVFGLAWTWGATQVPAVTGWDTLYQPGSR